MDGEHEGSSIRRATTQRGSRRVQRRSLLEVATLPPTWRYRWSGGAPKSPWRGVRHRGSSNGSRVDALRTKWTFPYSTYRNTVEGSLFSDGWPGTRSPRRRCFG